MNTIMLFYFLSISVPLSLGMVWLYLKSRQNPRFVLHYGLCPSHPSWYSFFTYFLIHQRIQHLISNLILFWILGILAACLSALPIWFIAIGCGLLGGSLLDVLFRHQDRNQPLIGMSAGNLSAAVALLSQLGKGIIPFYVWLISFFVAAIFFISLIQIEKKKLPSNFYPHLGGTFAGILIGFLFILKTGQVLN